MGSSCAFRSEIMLIWKDYPSYELYTDQLRDGVFGPKSGKQLRLVVGKDRKVKDAIRL